MKKINITLVTLLFVVNSVYSEDVKEYIKKANKYWSEGKTEMAEIYYKKVIQIDPENYKAYLNLGKINYFKDNSKEAIENLKKAMDLNSKDIEVLYAAGKVYSILMKDSENALKCYKSIMKIDKNYSFAYLEAGGVYYTLLRNKEKTVKNWEKFLELNPAYEQAEDIKRAIALLKDPNYEIPSTLGEDTSVVTVTDSTNGIRIRIRGKDLKAPSEVKKGSKGRKGIVTE